MWCAAFWLGRYRAGACWKKLTGLWVSATSPVLAGVDRHGDCCGVSCQAIATTSAELYSRPSKLGRSCPLPPVCPARSPPLPGKKKRPPEGGGDGGLGRYLHSQSVQFFPTNPTPWAAAMCLAIPSFRLRAPGRTAALVDLEMPNEDSLEGEQKELTLSRDRVETTGLWSLFPNH